MDYVLLLEQQEEFVKLFIEEKEADETEMKEIIEGCRYFFHKVYGNSYFLSRSIETEIRRKAILPSYVQSVYELTDQYFFFIEEISADFVDYILRNPSKPALSLDSDISLLHYSYLTRYE